MSGTGGEMSVMTTPAPPSALIRLPADRAVNRERGTWDRIDDSQTTLTIRLSDTVGEISITPDFRPAVFRITEPSLLEPEH